MMAALVLICREERESQLTYKPVEAGALHVPTNLPP